MRNPLKGVVTLQKAGESREKQPEGSTREITAPLAVPVTGSAPPETFAGATSTSTLTPTSSSPSSAPVIVDLNRRRAQLSARVAELQFDLGGLVYEMAIRDRIRVDVIVKRAALLQDADAELSEVERILRLEETSTAGSCANCGAPHSSGAGYCWQCGQPLLQQVPHSAIG